MVILTCKQCNQGFLVKPYRKNTANYCSQKCSRSSPARLAIVSKKLKGRNINPETNFKSGHKCLAPNALSNWRKMGGEVWNKGKDFLQIRGENNPNWMGYDHDRDYPSEWSKKLKREIRERDNHTCGVCGISPKDKSLDVHHIDYKKSNCSKENLISLCKKCHMKTNHKREYWMNYFINLKGCVASAQEA